MYTSAAKGGEGGGGVGGGGVLGGGGGGGVLLGNGGGNLRAGRTWPQERHLVPRGATHPLPRPVGSR